MTHDVNDRPTDLEARLRAEEPPIYQDDTPPSSTTTRLEHRLLAEEPPISADDTNPSMIMRQVQATDRGTRKRGSRFQRALVLFVLVGAVILTGIEAYLWMKSEEEADQPGIIASEETPVAMQAPAVENTPAPSTATATPPSTQTPVQVTQTENQPEPQTENAALTSNPAAPPAEPLPTAAIDEIAAALLLPVMVVPPTNVIARNNTPFTIRSAENRTHIVQYTVQSGDTLESIAAKFGLEDVYTIIWSNPRNKYTTLRPGTQLTILPEDGVYHEVTESLSIAAIAEQYGVAPYAIIDADYNNLFGSLPETVLPQGLWVAVPGGESERVNFLAPAIQTASSGGGSGAGVITGTYNLWGCTSQIGGGTAPYNRPLQYYQWMQSFSLGYHEAVDLSGNIGDPVFAAGGGTVAYAGWNDTGYGYVIVLAHGSTFSLYGHLDSYNVSCGQSVSAGAVIGTVGNTGNSSGPHLHFEIRDANWNAHNPQNYIGF